MPIATATGEKLKSLRNELDQLVALESPSAEELEKAVKLNEEINGVEVEYVKLKGVDDATEARKAADEAEKVKSRQPVSRPSLALISNNGGNLDAERDVRAVQANRKSWADSFIDSVVYKAVHERGHESSTRYTITVDEDFSIKAAGDPITTSQFGTRQTDLTILPHGFPPENIIPLIGVQQATQASVRYYPPTDPITGGANWTAEAAAKPEAQPRWGPVDAPIETLAVWTAVTLQALDDLPSLRSAIDTDLRMSVLNKLDNDLLNGTGTTPQIRGILNFAGVQTVAFVATTSPQDMIAKGIAAVTSVGYGAPTGIVMNYSDYWAMRVTKNQGYYLFGPPTDVGTPSVFGVPVVTSTHLAAGTALVGNFRRATFYQRQGITFVVGLKNDDLIKNLITIVCEMRGTLGVAAPSAFAKVALV